MFDYLGTDNKKEKEVYNFQAGFMFYRKNLANMKALKWLILFYSK